MEPIITSDIYELVTFTLLRQLEQGTIPWKQPWRNVGLPRNYITKRPYRGVNHLLLKSLNYPVNEFLTFRQAQSLGGRVLKGEKGHLVTYWLWHEDSPQPHKLDLHAKGVPTLRYYFVFNITQCTGIASNDEALVTTDLQPDKVCEQIIKDMPNAPHIVHNENSAYYETMADFINIPPLDAFYSSELYYVSLYHELVHATGAEHRLGRKEIMDRIVFGSDAYSREELTAEIGACYLASYSNIAPATFDNNAAYIKHWLRKLREDKRIIVYASAHAQRAVDYILNITHGENKVVDLINSELL